MFAPLFHIGAHAHSTYSLLLLFAAVASFSLGMRVLVREKGSTISRWFFIPTLIMGLWLVARAMAGSAEVAWLADAWTRASYVTFPLLPAAFLQFAFVAVGRQRMPHVFLLITWIVGVGFSAMAITTPLLISGVWRYPWGHYPRYGDLGWLFILYFFTLGAISLGVFYRAAHGLPPSRRRRRLVQFAFGYAAGFIGVLDFLPAYGIAFLPLGHLAALASTVLVGHSIRRNQLVDITPAFAGENIISTIADALIVTDDEGWIRIVNEAACSLSGYEQAQLVGAPLRQLLPVAEAGDRELQTREGAPIPVALTVSTLRDGERRAGEVIIARDMRERRRIEEALQQQALHLRTEQVRHEAELEYRTLVESMSDGIIHVDGQNVIRFLNVQAAAIIGVEHDAVCGKKIDEAIGGELYELLSRDPGQNRSEQVALATPGQGLRWIEISISPVLDESGAGYGTICVLKDVTDQRLMQQIFAASAREWRETFDAIQMPLIILEPNCIVRQANRAALERTCMGEVGIGKAVKDLGKHELWEQIDLLARTGQGNRRAQFREQDGTTWDLALDEIGEAEQRRFVVAARDISAIVQLQESLRRSETMSALGSVVAGVAHEVRNPLFAMTSTLDAFSKRLGQREEYLAFASVLRSQVDRVSNLMSDLLEFGRPAPTAFAVGSIGPLIDEAILLCLGEAHNLGVTIHRGDDATADVSMNEDRLLQVFTNLIRNAVQYSANGGEVMVRVTPVESAAGEHSVICTVRDHGPGFRDGDHEDVFEPFFTRRKGGIGLGLAIARAIVEQHHGTITAANHEEGGALVSVELPVARNAGVLAG